MLKLLSIRNYALISCLDVEFSNGFSVITGETGAGKSIILGALSMIVGARTDVKLIRDGEDKCLIEGVFDVSKYGLEVFLRERDVVYEGEVCVIRRELWRSGRSRAFVNDSPVSLGVLREIGSRLIDVHSQFGNLMLGDGGFQLGVIDVFAQDDGLRGEYRVAYERYISINKRIEELRSVIDRRRADEDYLRFRFGLIDGAGLVEGEQVDLEGERDVLLNVEGIKSGLFDIGRILCGEDVGVVGDLRGALVAARGLCGLLPEAEEIAKRIEGIYVDLKDIARDVDVLMGRIELRPDRLREVMDRLDVIYSLERRFGVGSVGELLVICDCLRREIGEIDGADVVLAGLEGELAVALGEMERLGGLLTGVRMGAAVLFEGRLREVVGELGMPSMCFSVDFSRRLMPDVTGFDVVRFMFSGGGGGVLKPVDETASGGEVSRLMLGVKFVIAGVTALPTIVFDEIDMGVSGEMADRMGRILREMGGWMQVIAISHLPQIAAKGVWHYIVFKSDRGGMAETGIRLLLDDERVMVIAKMLSGECLSDAAVDNARALMVV